MKKIMGRVGAASLVVATAAFLASPTAWANIHNFGGYSAPVTSSASAEITSPSSTSCSSGKAAIIDAWVGLTNGQLAANAGVSVKCTGGSPITYVSGSAGTATFRFPINPGDVISISVSETSTATSVSAMDETTTVNETANSVGAAAGPTIVQFGVNSVSKTLPIFGSMTYSSMQVDGAPIDPSTVTLRKLTRSHPPNILPGPLSSGSYTLTETQKK